MAIYQAPRRRWRLVLGSGVVGILVGIGLGLVVAGGPTDARTTLRELDGKLEAAAAPLDVLAIHGEQETGSARDARVITDALTRTARRFDEVRATVRMINGPAVSRFDDQVAELRRLARSKAGTRRVAAAAEKLADLLRNIVR